MWLLIVLSSVRGGVTISNQMFHGERVCKIIEQENKKFLKEKYNSLFFKVDTKCVYMPDVKIEKGN